MSTIQVFIPTYNRPQHVVKTLKSVLNQTFTGFELIISDNSTNEETKQALFPLHDRRIRYIRRQPSLSAIDHFNTILNDVTADYFMIFHDDDIMHENMIEILLKTIKIDNNYVAVGSNARVIKQGKLQKKCFYNHLKSDIIIKNLSQMVVLYSNQTFVPFPSYLYQNEVAKRQHLNYKHGGKHCDAAFIINLLTLGSVVFVAKPLMEYHIHSGQDSAVYDFKAFSQLIGFIKNKMEYNKNHPLIQRMRVQNIYAELKFKILNKQIPICSPIYFNIICVLLKYSPLKYFIQIIIITLLSQFHKIKNIK